MILEAGIPELGVVGQDTAHVIMADNYGFLLLQRRRPRRIVELPDGTYVQELSGILPPRFRPIVSATAGGNKKAGAKYFVLLTFRSSSRGIGSDPGPISAAVTMTDTDRTIHVSQDGWLPPLEGDWVDEVGVFVSVPGRPIAVAGDTPFYLEKRVKISEFLADGVDCDLFDVQTQVLARALRVDFKVAADAATSVYFNNTHCIAAQEEYDLVCDFLYTAGGAQGSWDAAENEPELSNATGTPGHFYEVSVPGSADFGAGSISFQSGDWVHFDGTVWEKLQPGTGGPACIVRRSSGGPAFPDGMPGRTIIKVDDQSAHLVTHWLSEDEVIIESPYAGTVGTAKDVRVFAEPSRILMSTFTENEGLTGLPLVEAFPPDRAIHFLKDDGHPLSALVRTRSLVYAFKDDKIGAFQPPQATDVQFIQGGLEIFSRRQDAFAVGPDDRVWFIEGAGLRQIVGHAPSEIISEAHAPMWDRSPSTPVWWNRDRLDEAWLFYHPRLDILCMIGAVGTSVNRDFFLVYNRRNGRAYRFRYFLDPAGTPATLDVQAVCNYNSHGVENVAICGQITVDGTEHYGRVWIFEPDLTYLDELPSDKVEVLDHRIIQRLRMGPYQAGASEKVRLQQARVVIQPRPASTAKLRVSVEAETPRGLVERGPVAQPIDHTPLDFPALPENLSHRPALILEHTTASADDVLEIREITVDAAQEGDQLG